MRRTIFFLALAATACSRSPSEPSTSSSEPPAATTPTSSTSTSTPSPTSTSTSSSNLALTWTDPAHWQRRKPSTSMRAAEYLVPHVGSDPEDAECIVITFGPGQGGGVDENIDRWVHQFASPTAGPTRATRSVNGMAVTRVEVAGTYTPMQMPGAAPPATRGASRLLGAIVQAPSGLWFFKLTGPDATVKAAAADFDAMIDSAKPR